MTLTTAPRPTWRRLRRRVSEEGVVLQRALLPVAVEEVRLVAEPRGEEDHRSALPGREERPEPVAGEDEDDWGRGVAHARGRALPRKAFEEHRVHHNRGAVQREAGDQCVEDEEVDV
eukprot:CAMPEP_0184216554 /NCGR_PEP_ID=MMETSP0976-20121227/15728_1 /TAXON_ID=483370 /ORGANISM="non described non described, Strain CCMP2097" /LENGTH=116 /DNA_ID=CAMNT_0026521339 /DNA_START=61 /DNA_END=411 /DNA_ORIENTATION=-